MQSSKFRGSLDIRLLEYKCISQESEISWVDHWILCGITFDTPDSWHYSASLQNDVQVDKSQRDAHLKHKFYLDNEVFSNASAWMVWVISPSFVH
jgi:hypothetical protein